MVHLIQCQLWLIDGAHHKDQLTVHENSKMRKKKKKPSVFRDFVSSNICIFEFTSSDSCFFSLGYVCVKELTVFQVFRVNVF